MGGGFLAAVLGFLAALILGLWAVIYYPIKRAWKNKKKDPLKEDEEKKIGQ